MSMEMISPGMLRRNSIVVLTILITLPYGSYAQSAKRIIAGKNIRVSLSKDYNYTFENMAAIDPSDPDHLVGAILTMCPDTVENCSNTLIESTDGGNNWKSESIPWGANPWCAILPNGTITYSYIYGPHYLLGVKRSRSSLVLSGKKAWSTELVFGGGYDHSMLVADMSAGPYHGNVYLVATQSLMPGDTDPFILVAKSDNGGHTFELRNHVHPFRNVDLNAKTPVIFNDGTLAIPIVVRGQYVQGETKATPFEETTNWLITSNDGGRTFSPPRFITSKAGNGYHALAIGKGNSSGDRLYYIYSGSNPRGIFVTHSDTRGEDWTRPLRIDGTTDSPYIIVGNVTVSQIGHLAVCYLKREDVNGTEAYNIYFALSTDGGNSFSSPIRINSKESRPNRKQGWFVNAWPQGGDYCSLIARPDGSFLALWSDARDGSFNLYQSTITVE